MLNKIKSLFIETKIELVLFSIIGFLLVFLISYINEYENSKYIPIAFSEMEEIENICKKESTNVPVITKYLNSTFDLTNKVFECWNESQNLMLLGSNTKSFASELDYRIDTILRNHKYEITDLKLIIQDYSDSLNIYFKKYIEVMNNSAYITDLANKTWKYDTYDHYHPETRTYTTTDSKGNSTTHTYIVMVYDYTDHTFTYYPVYGEILDNDNFKFINDYHNFFYDENLITSNKVGANNEYAIQKSRKNKIDSSLSQEQILFISKQWATNSFYTIYNAKLHVNWDYYNQLQPAWTFDKLNSHSIKFRTTSHRDDGPKEYRTVQKIKNTSNNINSITSSIIFTIRNTKINVIKLEQLIKDYIDVSLNNKEGDAEELKYQIMHLTKNVYESNFIGQEKINMFNWWIVIGWSLFGAFIGLIVGFAIDSLIDKIHYGY